MEEADVSTQPGQPDAMRGDGNQPAELGYAPPNPGGGDSGDSEIPIGVDALTDEQKAKGQEAAADSEGDGGALDVSAIVGDDGDDGDDGDATAEAGAEADADGGAEAEADADADAGAAADEAGDDAPVKTDAEAQVAANTGDA